MSKGRAKGEAMVGVEVGWCPPLTDVGSVPVVALFHGSRGVGHPADAAAAGASLRSHIKTSAVELGAKLLARCNALVALPDRGPRRTPDAILPVVRCVAGRTVADNQPSKENDPNPLQHFSHHFYPNMAINTLNTPQ